MKKISFSKDVLPHAIAIGIFLIVTIFFYNPIFFENKAIDQGDIQQWEGSSKSMRDFRDKTGEEALWSEAMFSGMPGYLVNVQWGNLPITYLKKIISFNLAHPICNIYLAFFSYYIMLLAFGVRPYLAIAGAIAFGLSNFMIVGITVGHSARIGAIAFMPLVMAGIHLVFRRRLVIGFGLTATALALHFRENHLQMTYYLMLIVAMYGIVQLISYFREKRMPEFIKAIGILVVAVVIAVGTFFGPMWAISEYTSYSRGGSELATASDKDVSGGVHRSYAFQYNYAIAEPMTLFIPNFYGGSGQHLLVQDRESNVTKAFTRNGDEQTFNQLAYFTSAYWGPDTQLPYYAGAITVFLFVVGIAFADKKYVWWLVPITVLAIMMSWGSNFASFNYFIFDYLPGYNKFRSVTFTVAMIIFSMPLLGMLGVEKILTDGLKKENKKKLLIAGGITGGLCLFFLAFAGILSFVTEDDAQLPPWLSSALIADRKGLLRSDAFRSFSFVVAIFIVLYFEVWKKFTPFAFYAFLIFMMTMDLAIVDKRYFTKENYRRKRTTSAFEPTEADLELQKDKSYYRVLNIQFQNPSQILLEARTSYFHHSIGGYHGVKIKRYQELFDSCLYKQTILMRQDLQAGKMDLRPYGAINMLNTKYLVYGPGKDNFIPNTAANGNAWFVNRVSTVSSPAAELSKVCSIDTRHEAVINDVGLKIGENTDSTASITLQEHTPKALKYESQSSADALAVFSEIFYPKGWIATIDGKEVPILRANYVLRALQVPAGKHAIEFRFEPAAYITGNKVTTVFSWVLILVLLGSVGLALKKEPEPLTA